MPRHRAQPDFQALFFDHFGSTPKIQRYELRFGGSNFRHDLVFLASLIHDAVFTIGSIRKLGKRLTIPIRRDMWEVGTALRRAKPGLHTINSRLSIGAVETLTWRFDGALPRSAESLMIQSLRAEELKPVNSSLVRLVIAGAAFELVLDLDEANASFVMQDTEAPVLYE